MDELSLLKEKNTNKSQLLSKEEAIKIERKLKKFANLMDGMVRIPFTKQGVGLDATLSSVPVFGDVSGLVLTGYAFWQGKKIGVPVEKMMPAVKLAVADMIVGVIPAAGTLIDIFIRPSRKTLEIVHEHIRESYDIEDELSVESSFLQESLEKLQEKSEFWKKPLVAWLYLHIPDVLGAAFLIIIACAIYAGIVWLF